MSNVRERSAVNQSRSSFQSLHEIRLDGVFQEQCKRARDVEIIRRDNRAVNRVRHDNFSEPLFQIGKIFRETENRHHFGRNRYIEARFARNTVSLAAESDDDISERAVIQIKHTFPNDASHVDFEFVALLQMIVEHSG